MELLNETHQNFSIKKNTFYSLREILIQSGRWNDNVIGTITVEMEI